MNNGNALGFVGVGAVMWLLPLIVPGWFLHVAVDGASTRALWVQLMGIIEFCLGMAFLARYWAAPAIAGWGDAIRARIAVSTAEWETVDLPRGVVAVDFAGVGLTSVLAGIAAAPSTFIPVLASTPPPRAMDWRSLRRGAVKSGGESAPGWRPVTARVRSQRSRPVFGAVFRGHPQHSFVHLANPNVVDLAQLANAIAAAESPEERRRFRDLLDRVTLSAPINRPLAPHLV